MNQIIEYCPNLIYKGLCPGTLTSYHYDRLNHLQLFKYACELNNIHTINHIIDSSINTLYFTLSCEVGNIRVVQLMIEKGATVWNWGLEGACEGGHLDLAKLMIEKGANWWDGGLRGVCEGGHLDLVRLMIEKGATGFSVSDGYPSNVNKILKQYR